MLDHTQPLGVDPRRVLSPREVQVMEIAAQGYTNQEVAARLNVSVHAVKFHLAAIYRKLGVANRTEAAVLFHTARSGNGPEGDGGPRH